jgi:XisH protein
MAKDIFHDTVKIALQNEGWQITHDPLTIKLSKRKIFIDLAAEKLLIAEKENFKIAVEVKSFVGLSPLNDFYNALGQYQLYILALKHKYPDWILYLAMPNESYQILKSDDLLAEFLEELKLKYIIFEPETQKILQWIN